jgi:hypothetical protein
MGYDDLVPLTKETVKEIAARGGRNSSIINSQAQKWAALKRRLLKKGLAKEDYDWVIARLENRDYAAAAILEYLDEIQKDCHPSQRIALANAMSGLAQFHHGSKTKLEIESSPTVVFNFGVNLQQFGTIQNSVKKEGGDDSENS